MLYRSLADLVVVLHLAFIVFVVVGALLAWRWPRLLWAHVPALAWAVGIIAIGYPCPLTPLERRLRRLAGGNGYESGFVDRYLEDVIYPGQLTPVLWALAAVVIVAGYAGVRRRRRPASDRGTVSSGWR